MKTIFDENMYQMGFVKLEASPTQEELEQENEYMKAGRFLRTFPPVLCERSISRNTSFLLKAFIVKKVWE